MTRTTQRNLLGALVMMLVGLLGLAAATGCDEGAAFGGDGYVAPADFSPYGYDYNMYDIFTSDL